jgi:hypothetical protein
MRVKVYKGRGPRQRFQSACGMHRPMRFWRVRFRALPAPAASALRRGQGLPPLSPAPLSPLAASFLRCAPDRFHLTKPNTFQHNREASVATLRWCSGSSRNAVRLPSEQAFSFAGIPKHQTTSLFDNPSIAAAAAAPPKATAQDFLPLNRWEATSEPASTIRLAVRPKTLCALRILSFFSIRQSLFGQAINGE